VIRAPFIFCLSLIPLFGYGADVADPLHMAVEQLAEHIKALSAPGDSFQLELASLLGSRLPGENLLRTQVENAFRARAIRLGDNTSASGKISITFSRNVHGPLIVAKVQRGEQVRVILLPFELSPPARVVAGRLERRLLWEQKDPILDLTSTENELWVLDSAALSYYNRQAGQWTLQRRLVIPHARPWPRDLRGMLHADGELLEAYLPGMLCRVEKLQFGCEESTAEWPLQSGPLSLRASFEPGRNFFSGFTTVASSTRPYISPFYGAGIVSSEGQELWLLTRPDGNAYLHNQAPEADVQQKEAGAFEFGNAGHVAAIPGWGSDIAVLSEACQTRSLVLAAESRSERTDEVQAYVILKQQLQPVAEPAEFPGPVTALWSKPDGTAVAVAHDRTSGRYAAYSLRVTCE